jgi:hypothetical protein
VLAAVNTTPTAAVTLEDKPVEARSNSGEFKSASKYLKDFESKKKREDWEQSKEDKFDEPPF